jgi:hypothetical protein
VKVRICLLGVILGTALIICPAGADSTVSESTFGLFTDETDIFTDPNDYEGVEFDKTFMFLRGGRNAKGLKTAADGRIDIAATGRINDNGAGIAGGFATRIKGLYLGLGFDTNLWKGRQTITEIDGKQADIFPTWGGPLDPAPDKGIVFDGGFEALLGTGNIGAFKLGFDFDQVSLNSAKNETEGADPEAFAYSDGKLLIALGWGKNFEFKGGTLAPEFAISYQVSTFKVEQKSTDAFSYVTYYDFEEEQWKTDFFEKMSHLRFGANAEYTSPSEAHWFGLDYALDIGIHPSTIVKTADQEIDWKGYNVGNYLLGSYKRTVKFTGQFSLAFGANLGFGLISQEEDYTDKPNPSETVFFGISPDVGIAAAYSFARKPFTLHGALSLVPSSEGESFPLYLVRYTNDNEDPKEETYTHVFTPWGLSAGLGLSFAPVKNFTLGINLSQNLNYYISDKLEYVWAWNIFDWEKHPFTAALQATLKF